MSGCSAKMGRRGDDHPRSVAGRGEVAHDHAEAVVERHGDADPVVLGVGAQLADEEPVVQDVVVRQGRALRETRGARGVLDVDGRAAEQYDGFQFRAARPHLGDHPGVVGGLQLLGRYEQRATRLVEHELQLTGAVRRVNVHQDRADLRGRVLGERPFGTVWCPDADPAPRAMPISSNPSASASTSPASSAYVHRRPVGRSTSASRSPNARTVASKLPPIVSPSSGVADSPDE